MRSGCARKNIWVRRREMSRVLKFRCRGYARRGCRGCAQERGRGRGLTDGVGVSRTGSGLRAGEVTDSVNLVKARGLVTQFRVARIDAARRQDSRYASRGMARGYASRDT
jgi:hypothetical protein